MDNIDRHDLNDLNFSLDFLRNLKLYFWHRDRAKDVLDDDPHVRNFLEGVQEGDIRKICDAALTDTPLGL